jgi:putative transposase
MHDWRETEALWRYGVIRDAVDERLTHRQRGPIVRELAAGMHEHPGGQRRELSRSSIDRWVRAYLAGGFDALKPVQRQGVPRTVAALLDQAAALRLEQPARTGAQIARILARVHGADVAPSARTVERHLARLGLTRQVAAGAPRVFGRFEADSPNELWISDALHGPVCAGPTGRPLKAICFAILDDHSRMIVAARFVAAETTLGLESVLRAALQTRGVPRGFYVDNGAPFASGQLARVCAVLGVRLTHSAPGRPQGRGKIERFFRTLRCQFLVELGDQPRRLEDLNRLLTAWIERVYHHATHSQTGQTPVERYRTCTPRHPTPEELRAAFLWAEQRTVAKTATLSLHSNTYEVDPVLTGRTVQLLFDPFDLDRVEVRHDGRSFGEARARQIARHVHPRAQAEPSDEPATPTGIDYLAMIEADHHANLARKISYRDTADRETGR